MQGLAFALAPGKWPRSPWNTCLIQHPWLPWGLAYMLCKQCDLWWVLVTTCYLLDLRRDWRVRLTGEQSTSLCDQPSLWDWDSVKILDLKAWVSSSVGNTLRVLSHVITGISKSWLHDSTGREQRKLSTWNCSRPDLWASFPGWLESASFHRNKL